MIRFGFSAFLKLLCSNVGPQRAILRGRLKPDRGGYDRHKSLRQRATRLIVEGEPIDDVLASCKLITNDSERQSAIAGLQKLYEWRKLHPGIVTRFSQAIYTSPGKKFSVKFVPDFAIDIDGVFVAIHLWNTRSARLDPRMVFLALSLVMQVYRLEKNPPPDIAVLSLVSSRLFRLKGSPHTALIGPRIVAELDRRIGIIDDERPPPDAPWVPPPI